MSWATARERAIGDNCGQLQGGRPSQHQAGDLEHPPGADRCGQANVLWKLLAALQSPLHTKVLNLVRTDRHK